MSNRFIGRFVASILASLIAGSLLLTYGQSQSGVVSDEDEADILETLVQLEIKSLDSEFGSVRTLLSENVSPLSATRLARHGFSMIAARDIQRYRQDHVIEYLVIRTMYRRDEFVVVALSFVREGRPCFAPAFSNERFFTYTYQKDAQGWVRRLVNRRPAPFSFARPPLFSFPRSLPTTP
jgi:hypothetical protein